MALFLLGIPWRSPSGGIQDKEWVTSDPQKGVECFGGTPVKQGRIHPLRKWSSRVKILPRKRLGPSSGLWSPDDQPAKIEFVKRLAAKGIDPKRDAVPEEELKAFTRVIVEEYFKRTRDAVKAFDPQLLYLGCRFAGQARTEVVEACAKHCDVVSYNIYRETIGDWRLPKGLDAPVMIGEFHFGATDRGPFGSS